MNEQSTKSNSSRSSSRAEHEKRLEASIDQLSAELQELDESMDKSVERIRQHCFMLRNRIQMRAERLADEIYNINEQMQAQVDKYERECIEAYKSSGEQRQQLKRELESKKQFCSQAHSCLAQLKLDKVSLSPLIDTVDQHLQDIDCFKDNLKWPMFNKRGRLQFVESKSNIFSSLLGNLNDEFDSKDQVVSETTHSDKQSNIFLLKNCIETSQTRTIDVDQLIKEIYLKLIFQYNQSHFNFLNFQLVDNRLKDFVLTKTPNENFTINNTQKCIEYFDKNLEKTHRSSCQKVFSLFLL
jgi:D-ribose pyranose/furanose isomerase RbsD